MRRRIADTQAFRRRARPGLPPRSKGRPRLEFPWEGREMAQIGAHRKFSILFVCTGNICRSSFSEVLARHLLAPESDGFEFASAGAAPVVGAPMHHASRAALEQFGAPSSVAESFRARQLT